MNCTGIFLMLVLLFWPFIFQFKYTTPHPTKPQFQIKKSNGYQFLKPPAIPISCIPVQRKSCVDLILQGIAKVFLLCGLRILTHHWHLNFLWVVSISMLISSTSFSVNMTFLYFLLSSIEPVVRNSSSVLYICSFTLAFLEVRIFQQNQWQHFFPCDRHRHCCEGAVFIQKITFSMCTVHLQPVMHNT